jgi:hypothetical protein
MLDASTSGFRLVFCRLLVVPLLTQRRDSPPQVSFWSSVDTMEGLSSRSLIMNEIMEFVILLYLFEEDASWLVKVTSVFVRAAPFGRTVAAHGGWSAVDHCVVRLFQGDVRAHVPLCVWAAVCVFSRAPQTLVLGVFKIVKSLRVKRLDRAKASGGASMTDEIDRLAFKYLSPPLLLLVLSYSGYSLYTGYHRGWYSWLIESLVALVCARVVGTGTPEVSGESCTRRRSMMQCMCGAFARGRRRRRFHRHDAAVVHQLSVEVRCPSAVEILHVQGVQPRRSNGRRRRAVATPCVVRVRCDRLSTRSSMIFSLSSSRCPRCTGCHASATIWSSPSSSTNDGSIVRCPATRRETETERAVGISCVLSHSPSARSARSQAWT